MSGQPDTHVQIDALERLASRSWEALQTSRARIEQSHVLLAHACDRRFEGGAIARLAREAVFRRAGALCMPSDVGTHARAEAILATAYEIDPVCVRRDLQVLASWELPFDELVVELCRLRDWEVGTATIYLGALRSTLVAGGVACSWLEADA